MTQSKRSARDLIKKYITNHNDNFHLLLLIFRTERLCFFLLFLKLFPHDLVRIQFRQNKF